MKKLLFATALVASVAAFADPINAISFEGYTAGATFANGATEKGEDGNNKSVGPFFCYDGDSDGSSVKAFGGENAAVPGITRPAAFATATPNLNYLDLSTEGGILWRSINNISQEQGEGGTTYDLGTAANVTADGIYLDTLVQFTPTEDGGTPELDGEDKLAIWLNVSENVTNLMVRAAFIDDDGRDTTATPTNFVVNTASPVVAGQWYRLTVKAIADVTQCKAKNPGQYEKGITGFEIYLDGVQLAAATTTIGDNYMGVATEANGEWAWLVQGADDDFITYLQSGKVFPSLKGVTTTDTLTAVGFKGSGALDDIVWTTEDPFANAPQPAEDYVVSINGSDVVITPTAADIEAFAQQGYTTVSNVNEALATPIPNGGGVLAWQALFLGIAPSAAGLESFKITSISFEDGKVVVTIPTLNDIKTGRGVDIILKLQGSNDLSTWSDIESKTAASGTVAAFSAITPGLGETHKFYKVVVVFAATGAQD